MATSFRGLVDHFRREGYPPRKAVRRACEEILAPYVTLEEARKAARELRRKGGTATTIMGFEVSPEAIEEAIVMAKKLDAPLAPTLALLPAAAGAIHHAVMELYAELMKKYGWPEAVAEAWRKVKKKHGQSIPSIALLPSRASRALHAEVLKEAHRIFKERSGKSAKDVLKEAWRYYGYPEGTPEQPPAPLPPPPATFEAELDAKQIRAAAKALRAVYKHLKQTGFYRDFDFSTHLVPLRYGARTVYQVPVRSFSVLADTKVKKIRVIPHRLVLHIDWGTGAWQFPTVDEDRVKRWREDGRFEKIPSLKDILAGRVPKGMESPKKPGDAERLADAAERVGYAVWGVLKKPNGTFTKASEIDLLKALKSFARLLYRKKTTKVMLQNANGILNDRQKEKERLGVVADVEAILAPWIYTWAKTCIDEAYASYPTYKGWEEWADYQIEEQKKNSAVWSAVIDLIVNAAGLGDAIVDVHKGIRVPPFTRFAEHWSEGLAAVETIRRALSDWSAERLFKRILTVTANQLKQPEEARKHNLGYDPQVAKWIHESLQALIRGDDMLTFLRKAKAIPPKGKIWLVLFPPSGLNVTLNLQRDLADEIYKWAKKRWKEKVWRGNLKDSLYTFVELPKKPGFTPKLREEIEKEFWGWGRMEVREAPQYGIYLIAWRA